MWLFKSRRKQSRDDFALEPGVRLDGARDIEPVIGAKIEPADPWPDAPRTIDKPFSGIEARCDKCGFQARPDWAQRPASCLVKTKYYRAGFYGFPPELYPEHFTRTCPMCGYQWNENVIEIEGKE